MKEFVSVHELQSVFSGESASLVKSRRENIEQSSLRFLVTKFIQVNNLDQAASSRIEGLDKTTQVLVMSLGFKLKGAANKSKVCMTRVNGGGEGL